MMVVIMLASASLGSQLGTAATRVVDASRIRALFGVTILSGSLAVALRQVSESVSGADFLAPLASAVLLGFAGLICILIAVMLVAAKLKQPASEGMGGPDTSHNEPNGHGTGPEIAATETQRQEGDG
jgi:hypothetical protein